MTKLEDHLLLESKNEYNSARRRKYIEKTFIPNRFQHKNE